jgi:hypothetical protein
LFHPKARWKVALQKKNNHKASWFKYNYYQQDTPSALSPLPNDKLCCGDLPLLAQITDGRPEMIGKRIQEVHPEFTEGLFYSTSKNTKSDCEITKCRKGRMIGECVEGENSHRASFPSPADLVTILRDHEMSKGRMIGGGGGEGIAPAKPTALILDGHSRLETIEVQSTAGCLT